MKKNITAILACVILFSFVSCATSVKPLKRAMNKRQNLLEFESISENLKHIDLISSFYEQSEYYTKSSPFQFEFIPYNDYKKISFDGEYIYFPFYIVQRYAKPRTSRYREPEHTIIGSHFIGISIPTGNVIYGPLGSYYNHKQTNKSLLDGPSSITKKTELGINQTIYYHPGVDSIPITSFLPDMGLFTNYGNAKNNYAYIYTYFDDVDALSTSILSKRDDESGFSIELINQEHSFYFAFNFTTDPDEPIGTAVFLNFKSKEDLLAQILVNEDIDGFGLENGWNRLGYTINGDNKDGSTFSGTVDGNGHQGKGIITKPDGTSIEGNFINNKLTGIGITKNKDGSKEFAYYENNIPVSPKLIYKNSGEIHILSNDNNLLPHISEFDQLPEDWVYWGGDHEYQGITLNGKIKIKKIIEYDGNIVATLITSDGEIIQGTVISGNLVQGMLSYPDGSFYTGSFANLHPAGEGEYVSADGTRFAGEFDYIENTKSFDLKQEFLDIVLNFPTANSVELVGNFGNSAASSLEMSGNGNWTASIPVTGNEPFDLQLFVNGQKYNEKSVVSQLAEIQNRESLRNSPILSSNLSLSARSSAVELAIGDRNSADAVLVKEDKELRDFNRLIEEITKDYLEFADAVQTKIANERKAAIEATLNTVGAIVSTSMDAVVAYGEAMEEQRATSSNLSGTAGGGNAAAIPIKNPAWTKKPPASPGSQLSYMVEAADRFYDEYVKAARVRDANAAKQYWQGHERSCRQAEKFAETLKMANQ